MVSGAWTLLPGRRLLPASAVNAYTSTWVVALPASRTSEPEDAWPAPRAERIAPEGACGQGWMPKTNPAKTPPATEMHFLLGTRAWTMGQRGFWLTVSREGGQVERSRLGLVGRSRRQK